MSIDEQNWKALQYVLGEMTDAERDSFESRLADDPALCEAVTEASRLVLTVQAQSEAVVMPSVVESQAQRSARSSWLAVAGASVSVALLSLFAVQIPQSTRPTEVAQHDPAAAELVSLWRSGSAGEADADEADGDLADAAGDVSVPDWMLAAVSLQIAGDDRVQEN